MRNVEIYLKDILDAMDSVEAFVEGMDYEAFRTDDKTSSAVLRKFEIIGEAAKAVPQNVREGYPEIPWKEMSGMRDMLIHRYFGIDIKLVWQTIKHRIPAVRPDLEKVLRDLQASATE